MEIGKIFEHKSQLKWLMDIGKIFERKSQLKSVFFLIFHLVQPFMV